MSTETLEEKPPETPVEKVSGEDLVRPLIEGMPEPTPSATVELPAPQHSGSDQTYTPNAPVSPPVAAPVNEFPNATDKKGQKFDPSIHRVNNDGSPRVSIKGTFIPLKSGRPPSDPNAPRPAYKPSTSSTIIPGQPAPVAPPDEYELAARAYVKGGTGAACAMISDEWAPENEAEEKWMVDMVAEYLRAKGEIDLSPGQVLALGLLAYAGKRIPKPKTQEKIKTWSDKFRSWFGQTRREEKKP